MDSFGKNAGPLILISNIPHGVRSVRPSRVRSFALLGSTTTATMCKTRNTGKIVLVASGHKGSRGPGVSLHTRSALLAPAHLPGFVGSIRALSLCGRTLGGRKATDVHATRRVTVCNPKTSHSLCPSAS